MTLPFDLICVDDKAGLKRFNQYVKDGYEVIETPFFELDGYLVEEFFNDRAFYVYFDPSRHTKPNKLKPGELVIDQEDKKIYKPVEDDLLRQKQVYLPSDAERYKNDLDLFNEVKEFLDTYHEQQNPVERTLDVLYVFLTYIADLLPVVPLRRTIGGKGKGKSRWKDGMHALCYRSLSISGAGSIPSLRRYLNRWNGQGSATLIIDEANFTGSDLASAIAKIICLGNEQQNAYISLCDTENNPTLLRIYGPKILSSRRELKDDAAESRILSFDAAKATKKMPLYTCEPFRRKAQSLRNKLILWRLKNYARLKTKAAELEDASIHDLFGERIDDRIKQICTPLFLLATDGIKDTLSDLVKQLQQDLLDKDEDAALAQAIKEVLFGDGEKPGLIAQVSQVSQVSVLGDVLYKIRLVEIRDALFQDLSKGQKTWKSRKIAQILRHDFGWRVESGTGNFAVVHIPGADAPQMTNLPNLANSDKTVDDPEFEVKKCPDGLERIAFKGAESE